MSTFSVELQDTQLLAAISNAISALEHPRPLMDAVGATLESAAKMRFQTKTDPKGNAWPALSPATLEIYDSEWFKQQVGNEDYRDGVPGSLLQRTGNLLRSLTHNVGDDWTEIGSSRASKGGKWQIGWLHETGTRKMPRRGFLVADPKTGELGADDQADVLDVVSRYLDGAFG